MAKAFVYDPKIADEICNALSTRHEGLEILCNENQHWPGKTLVWEWLRDHPDFAEKYAHARRFQVEVRVDKAYDIATDTKEDWTTNENGKIVPNHDHINRAKLQIDLIKWIACKIVPRIYGDKQEHDVKVADISRQTRETENEYKKNH